MAKLPWWSLMGCYGGSSSKSTRRQRASTVDGGGSTSPTTYPCSPEDLSLNLIGSDMAVFSVAELSAATRNFSKSQLVGEGGFGPVFKGFVDGSIKPGLEPQAVAVKILDKDGAQGHKEWLAEVIFLGQLRHPNLVKLIGYCCEEEHRMLVYEFMPGRSVENHLFQSVQLAPLTWTERLNIAIGAAKGLAFLHEEAEKPIIYRDFKASNILLDSDHNKAKLSDFGLAKDGPEGDNTHISTRVMGTHGYAAPEYVLTGHLTARSDVYSFGVVLLELLTGRRSVDKLRPAREQNLVDWAKPYLAAAGAADSSSRRRLCRIIDPALNGEYSTEGARRAAEVAHRCLSRAPKTRPTMRAVVAALEPLLDLKDIPPGYFVYLASGPEAAAVDVGGVDHHHDDGARPNSLQQGHLHKQRRPLMHYDDNGLHRESLRRTAKPRV